MASFLGSKLDRVARLLAGDADPAAGSDYACTPTSARSVAGPAAPGECAPLRCVCVCVCLSVCLCWSVCAWPVGHCAVLYCWYACWPHS